MTAIEKYCDRKMKYLEIFSLLVDLSKISLQTHCFRYGMLDTRWYVIHEAWYAILDTWCLIHDTWWLETMMTWYVMTWFIMLDTMIWSNTWWLDTWCLILEAWYLMLDTWYEIGRHRVVNYIVKLDYSSLRINVILHAILRLRVFQGSL